jgi:hypothetical protein
MLVSMNATGQAQYRAFFSAMDHVQGDTQFNPYE